MAKGSCLCGAIAFELDNAAVVGSVACYCGNCRKVSGGQFGIYLQVRRDGFRWLSGEGLAETYESSPGNLRAHCPTCGCVAPIATTYGAIRVAGGTLDDDPEIAPEAALFAPRKVSWCGVDDAKVQFADAGPREFWMKMLAKLHQPRVQK